MRIERVVELLATHGGDAQIVEDAEAIRIQGNGCPGLKSRGSDHPAGCSIMQAMLGMLLGVPVTEVSAIRRGAASLLLGRPPASTSTSRNETGTA